MLNDPHKYRLLIFDLDGTLIDSANDIAGAVNELLVSRGRSALPTLEIRRAIGGGMRDLISKVFADVISQSPSRSDALAETEAEFSRLYDKHLVLTSRLYPGVMQTLQSLRQPLALVTNKPIQHTLRTLRETELGSVPWASVFGGDSLAQKKPDPLPLIEACRRSGVEVAQALMIGDGLPDVLAAKRAGMDCVAVTYGYADPKALLAEGPTATIDAFGELLPLIGLTTANSEPEGDWRG